MTDGHSIHASGVSASVSSHGAELVSLKDALGEELLWQAGPEWPRHAPVLFPIVGKLKDDALRHAGAVHRVTQHGFARDSAFRWLERSPSRAVLELTDDAATRALYPFAFALRLDHSVEGSTLTVAAEVENPSKTEPLPFAIGAHPGFRWPLYDGAKENHTLEFELEEPGPARAVVDALIGGEVPAPIDGRTMRLSPDLFAKDAVVLPGARSRSVRYGVPGGRSILVSWEGYDDLGIWSKGTDSPFLCIEPWRGMASPYGWDGAFVDKPGLSTLKPGESARFTWRVTL